MVSLLCSHAAYSAVFSVCGAFSGQTGGLPSSRTNTFTLYSGCTVPDLGIDQCGVYIKETSAQYIEVLEFKQKVLIFDMGSSYDLVRKKKIIYNLNCSVVLDLGCKETKEGYYTIEDLLKGKTK